MDYSKPDSASIRRMFDELAPRYDFFNFLSSMGMDKNWRDCALLPVRPGMRVLDLGCGTGDLSFGAVKKIQGSGEVVGLDFSESMLFFAEKRREKLDPVDRHAVRFVLKKAEDLPLEGERFDIVVSGFVLRNIYENIDAILGGVYESLKEGGRISFLDITEPPNAFLRVVWKFYMTTIVAFYGKILFGKAYPLFYLTDSARRFLNAREFVEKLKSVGFEQVRKRPFLFGIVTLYQAEKNRKA